MFNGDLKACVRVRACAGWKGEEEASLHQAHGAARGVDRPGHGVLTVVHDIRFHHTLHGEREDVGVLKRERRDTVRVYRWVEETMFTFANNRVETMSPTLNSYRHSNKLQASPDGDLAATRTKVSLLSRHLLLQLLGNWISFLGI